MKELGLDLGLLISQAVNFGLLVLLLNILLYRPVLRKLEERANRIKKGTENAACAEKTVQEAEQHYKEEIERAEHEVREIIENATRAGEQQRQEILAKARQEAHELILRAQQRAQRETQGGQIALHQQIVDLALSAASRLIGENMDEEKHHQLVERFLSEVSQLE